ncbi:sensor histidine kinase [Dyadobacter sp. 3J3]|uniref:sensor histidine kinase n=1 Tax=Dyadobacter sp. 3J3 TaxID=2606600 RepID=UPI0013599C03|nr:sensor histidine kinase [Dyadobacter sp. 3J3]
MGKKNKQIWITIFFFLPLISQAQPTKLSPEKQLLFLQLSLNYYTVVKEGRVNQDSSLLLVSRKNKISRSPVIIDDLDNQLLSIDNKWVDSRQTKIATSKLSMVQGLDHLKLLVILGAYYAFQPGYRQMDRDSAQYFLTKAKIESESLHSTFWLNYTLCLLGKNYFKENRVKEGTDCFKTVIIKSHKSGDKKMEAKAWDMQGTYIPPGAATMRLKVNSIEKANEIYKLTGQAARQINSQMNLSYLYFLLKNLNGAKNSALVALSLQRKLGFPYLHYTYDILSLIDIISGNEHNALEYELKTIKSSLATKDSLGLPYFYTKMGHIKGGRQTTAYEFSDYWLKKAMVIFSKNRDQDIYLALINHTDNLNASGKSIQAINLLRHMLKDIPPASDRIKNMVYQAFADTYHTLKNYRLAEKYYILTDEIQERDSLITKNIRASQIKYTIGMFYFENKKYSKAESYLKKYLELPGPKDEGISALSDVHMALYKIDSLNGNYKSASANLYKHITFKNKYTSTNDAKSIAELKLQVLMIQKEKDLQILEAKSALQIQQARNLRIFIIVGLSIAILIISLLYNRYYINRKQSKEIDKKNVQLLDVIKEKNELLLSKEWLLKEVHHRVKNNLHTVICLLESQAGYLENDALKALEISQHRIYAMSLIHQKLYQSEDIKTVDMSVFLPEFVGYLRDSFDTGNRIRFELDVDSIKLGVSYAVPLSLIINEAVTNSIKYAFPNGKRGIVLISLKEFDDQVSLKISDNGIGIPVEQLGDSSSTLGLKLLRGLSEDIKADCQIENYNGTTITIGFKIDELLYVADI